MFNNSLLKRKLVSYFVKLYFMEFLLEFFAAAYQSCLDQDKEFSNRHLFS